MLPVFGAETQSPPQDSPSETVEVVVYSDFQCPFCGQFYKPFRQLMTEGIEGVPIKFEFKNFPLSFHPYAQLAAQAAMAAKQQGKFWEMHDAIFAHQSAMKRENLLEYAEQLGLDMNRFLEDMDSEPIKQMVERDKAEGAKANVDATPTVVIDGKAYSGSRTFPELKKMVQGDRLQRRAV
ncbi:MAG TPA: thioredoxin domain-containing protein, partial [Tepidisphaeraceae bacterium]